jgi:hypothetical protein
MWCVSVAYSLLKGQVPICGVAISSSFNTSVVALKVDQLPHSGHALSNLHSTTRVG